MSHAKSDYLENAMLALLFNGTSLNTIFQDATSPSSLLYVGLHTAALTDTGNMSSNEASYTSYVRTAVARNTSGWTVSGSCVHPTTTISFAQATGGSETITHFSVGLSTVSTADFLYYGTVTPNMPVSNGVTPQLTTATAIEEK